VEKMSKEEIIKIIDKELENIRYKQVENKAKVFDTNIFDYYAITLRDDYYLLEGEQNALIRIKNKILYVDETAGNEKTNE
jgi:hypothetical protein